MEKRCPHCTLLSDAMSELSASHRGMQERALTAEARLELQRQLHADNTADLHARHTILKERAVSMAAWAQQHRLASRKHAEKLGALEEAHGRLKDEHAALKEAHQRLTERHDGLGKDFAKLAERHVSALRTLDALERSHRLAAEKSEERHRSLVNEISRLEQKGPRVA